jgi:hypothetical protein
MGPVGVRSPAGTGKTEMKMEGKERKYDGRKIFNRLL